MVRNLCLAGILVVFSLTTGCSSPPPKPKAPPPPSQPAPKVETPPAETPKPADPTKTDVPKAEPAKPAEPTLPAPTEKKEEPAKDESKKEEAPAATDIKMVPLGKETGFEDQDASGKNIRAWISVLESDNKEQVIEALGVYQMVGKKGAIALPKVEFLTKSNDAEIAAEARAALDALKNKD